ncbi:hypothetical protein PTSG_09784 [Salpingoeca rosetta]|uniref:Serine-threonine/tyrosine-protein kinase catalytic domain-containing protein n=1 Tax=Salpingoeca rosetta (strain ATCC 50818 / BSB-021) TaxID=946362 RepID=F2UP19_SALR5|nr:uncharacterized protein PTSG_09784 [Salpingoeca rosetta]EGD79374.1 hypothetical protein PTSG_09784 [Salpingoeca rosetta]|eukprot:XP_004989143.1 hypothetical protein PTSG_09784 [Salpingoeca rosetta]
MLGTRMDKPNGCPDSLYVIMRQCWHMGPNSRPDFEDLLASLVELHRAYSRSETRAGVFNPRKSIIMNLSGGDDDNGDGSHESFHQSRRAIEQSFHSPTGGARNPPSDRLTKISYSPTPDEAADSNRMAALRSHVGNYTLGRGLAKSIKNLRNTSESPHRLRSISDVEDTMKPTPKRHSHSAVHHQDSPNLPRNTKPHHSHHGADYHAYDRAEDTEELHGVRAVSDKFDEAFALDDIRRSNPLYHLDEYDNVLAYKRDPVRREFIAAAPDDIRAGELVFERVHVFPGQTPRPEKFEFWDPHDRDYMYVPMSEDLRFHIVRGINA